MYKWTLLNRDDADQLFTHYVFLCERTGEVALADHSIQRLSDPSTTDDGLALVDGPGQPELLDTRHIWNVPVLVSPRRRVLLGQHADSSSRSVVPTSQHVHQLLASLWPKARLDREARLAAMWKAQQAHMPDSVMVPHRAAFAWARGASPFRKLRHRLVSDVVLLHPVGLFYLTDDEYGAVLGYRYGTEPTEYVQGFSFC